MSQKVNGLRRSQRLSGTKDSSEERTEECLLKDWCLLPLEMRRRCMEAMDVKTRIRMRRTSKIEKSLVDSKKFLIDSVTMSYRYNRMYVTAGPRYECNLLCSTTKKRKTQCLQYLFTECRIEDFRFNGIGEFKEVGKYLSGYVPFQFKRITIGSQEPDAVKYLLENCTNLERITFWNYLSLGDELFGDVLALPVVTNVKDLRFVAFGSLTHIWNLIQKWIDIDAETGKSLQIVSSDLKSVSVFVTMFQGRIIQSTENEARIRMNDAAKQILWRNIGVGRTHHDFASCKVIPADLPEVDYGKGDEWITALHKEDLDGKCIF